MKKKNTVPPNDNDPDEMYQSLTGKNIKGSKSRTTNIRMYAKVRAPPVNGAPRRDVPPSPRRTAAEEDTKGKKKTTGPFQRGRANKSIPVAGPITKTKELGRATGASVTTTTASRPRGAVTEEVTRPESNRTNAKPPSSPAASSTKAAASSSPRRQEVKANPPPGASSTEQTAPPQGPRRETVTTPAPPAPQRHVKQHGPSSAAIAVQDNRVAAISRPAQPHGVTGTEEVRVVREEDWLSMLIPDENSQTKGIALFDELPTDGAVVVDFSSNDFCTNFDNHNDSDSIIWDPNAEAVATSFFPPATDTPRETVDPSPGAGDDAFAAREGVDVKAPTELKEMTREADEVRDGIEADPTDSEELLPLLAAMSSSEPNPPPSSEVPIFRSSQGGGQPPMATVLVCKVTTAGTAATTSRSASSSSSSSTSSAGTTSDESQASSKEEERQDPFEEDGISDMETEGVEEKHVPVPEAPAVVAATLSPSRAPPRPVRRAQVPAARVPSPEPREDALLQRRLSFSSLKMMLDKHSSTAVRREVVELESLDYWLDDDDDDAEIDGTVLNDDEADPDIFTDGREDTYSFIGADYSFGADRSLVSLLPM